MSSSVASLIFAARNAAIAMQSHNPVRAGLAVSNATKVAGTFSHSAAMKTAGKVAGKAINPLMIVSAGYNVYKSDDKIKTAAQEGAGLASMFALEKQLRKGKISEYLSKGTDWIMKKCSKSAKTQYIGAKILSGIAVVAATLAGYELAYKAGEKAIDIIRRSNPKTVDKNYDASLAKYVSNLDNNA